MRVTITNFRQELFKLADRALRGEPLEFTHKGVVFKVTPEIRPSKLSQLIGQTVVAQDASLERTSRALLKEMKTEWEKDWSEL